MDNDRRIKGFTLVELLVVITIIAILAVVVILTLNPVQLLRQARDSARLSDFASLKSSIALYLSDVTSGLSVGTELKCYAHTSSTVTTNNCADGTSAARFLTTTTYGTSNSVAVDSNGWLPINFSAIVAGSPLSVLPLDPINNATYFYAYAAGSNYTYELNAHMESTRYRYGGSNDVESRDGGSTSTLYEVGTNLSL